jgi:hypothetical protein
MTCRWFHRSIAVFLPFVVCMVPAIASAQVTEYFDASTFQASAGAPLTVIGFDDVAPNDGKAELTTYQPKGLTVRNRDGFGINIVENTKLPYGDNFVTLGQINSPKNVVSSGFRVSGASGVIPDNLYFEFDKSMSAAGLWIGSLGGGGCEDAPTVVEFVDGAGAILAEEKLTRSHAGVAFGATGFAWDNRLFYGVVSATPIRQIRVHNGADGCDVISFDDVQFVPVAEKFTITIDPGRYSGEYYILENLFFGRGKANLSLAAGTYVFDNASGGRFSFEVTPTGTLTKLSNTEAAEIVDTVLRLKTANIHVDPQHYTGGYLLLGQCCSQGPKTFTVVSGLKSVFDNFSGGRFSFLVDSIGDISDVENARAAFAQSNTLVLNNVTIRVDPQGYLGQYLLLGHCCSSGPQSFIVIPDLLLQFDNFAGDRFSFKVSSLGGRAARKVIHSPLGK